MKNLGQTGTPSHADPGALRVIVRWPGTICALLLTFRATWIAGSAPPLSQIWRRTKPIYEPFAYSARKY